MQLLRFPLQMIPTSCSRYVPQSQYDLVLSSFSNPVSPLLIVNLLDVIYAVIIGRPSKVLSLSHTHTHTFPPPNTLLIPGNTLQPLLHFKKVIPDL